MRRRIPECSLSHSSTAAGTNGVCGSGTLAVPGIVGLGIACQIAEKEMTAEAERTLRLREKLRKGIMWKDSVKATSTATPPSGSPETRTSASLTWKAKGLMMGIKDIAVSSGSACTSASLEPSYVLRALSAWVTNWPTAVSPSGWPLHHGRRSISQSNSW